MTDRLIHVTNRAAAHTRYAVDGLVLQSVARHKAELLITALHALRLFRGATGEQQTKATETVVVYNDAIGALLPNLAPNRDKIAQLIAETLLKVDELCNDILAVPVPIAVYTPPPPAVEEPVAAPAAPSDVPKRRGRPPKADVDLTI